MVWKLLHVLPLLLRLGLLLVRRQHHDLLLLIWRVMRLWMEEHHSAIIDGVVRLVRDQHGVMLHGGCRVRLNRTELMVLEAHVVWRRWVALEVRTLLGKGALVELRPHPSRDLR